MFDIGFAELILIGVVGLLVIGPERLPGAIRTASQWLSHFKRSFNNVKREIEHELEIDSVKRQLDQANAQFKTKSEEIKRGLEGGLDSDKATSDSGTSDSGTSDNVEAKPPTNKPPDGTAR
jgi:sec-independent protein translocase protein TatB